MGKLLGKVAIVTGAGQGLGRLYAEAFAREGAAVLLNDLTPENGPGGGVRAVANEIVAGGGRASVVAGDCSDWAFARELVEKAVNEYGRLDILINNAGIVRDRMPFNMSEDEWDDVIRVHLKGHFAPTRFACAYWRDAFKAGEKVAGRIINTTSSSGIWGQPGQPNYSAAKAGVIGLTYSLAQTMHKYGVTSNVIAPNAETRPDIPIDGIGPDLRGLMLPEHIPPVLVYLASDEASHVNGEVFYVTSGRIDRVLGCQIGDGIYKNGVWTFEEISASFPGLNCQPRPAAKDVMIYLLTPILNSTGDR